MTDPKQTGTPTPEGTDAPKPETSGTTGTDDRDGKGEPLHLEWKGKAEKYNEEKKTRERVERENAELKKRLEQSPAVPGQKGSDAKADRVVAVKAFADQGDPVSQELLALREEQQTLIKATADADMIRRMPEDEQEAVLEHYLANQHRLGDPHAARAEIREKSLAEELVKQNEENAKLKRALEEHQGHKPDPDVVRTHSRETTAVDARVEKMSPQAFDAEIERLRSLGLHGQVMKLQSKLSRDEIQLTG